MNVGETMEIPCSHCEESVTLENDESGIYVCPHCNHEFEYISPIDDWISGVEKERIVPSFVISEDTRNNSAEKTDLGICLILGGCLFMLGFFLVIPALLGLYLVFMGVSNLMMDPVITKHHSSVDLENSRIVNYTLKNGQIERVRTHSFSVQPASKIVSVHFWSGQGDGGPARTEIYITQRSGPVKLSYANLDSIHASNLSTFLEIPHVGLIYKSESHIEHDEVAEALEYGS